MGARDVPEDRWVRRLEEDPGGEAAARAGHRSGEGLGAARSRGRGLPDRSQVVVHAAQRPDAEVHGLQLGRERTRDLPRPRHPPLQPARADRRHGHRRLLHELDGRLQLHPRRVHGGAVPALRGRGAGGVRRGPAGQEHPGLGRRFRPVLVHGCGRLHLRRRDRAARVARRQAGTAALQAAVPGQLRPFRQADDDQQRAELRLGADDPAQGTGVVRRTRPPQLGWHGDLLGLGPRRKAGQLRSAARHSVLRNCSNSPAACGRAASSRP